MASQYLWMGNWLLCKLILNLRNRNVVIWQELTLLEVIANRCLATMCPASTGDRGGNSNGFRPYEELRYAANGQVIALGK